MYFRVAPLAGNPRGVDMDMMRDFIREKSFVNGAPVLSLSVRRETGSNVIDIKRAMQTVC
jgi:hypothetical protein